MKKTSAAILAGGKAVRFNGRDKAFLEVEGRTIFERMLSVLEPIFDEIIVVTDRPEQYAEFGPLVCAHDIFRDRGPLSGVHAALDISTHEIVFIFGCDLPFLQPAFIRHQLLTFSQKPTDILVPSFDDKIEPLHTIYRKSILPLLEHYFSIAQDKKTRSFFPFVNTRYMDVSSDLEAMRSFININSPKDIDILNKSVYIAE